MKLEYTLRKYNDKWFYEIFVDGKKYYESMCRFPTELSAELSANHFIDVARANPEIIEEDIDDV